jgi:integrase
MTAARINFTVAALKAIPPAPLGKRVTYHDVREPGLQLRVGPTGKKQFSVFKRTKNGGPERVTIGAFPDVSIEQARAKALQIRNAIAQGLNPAESLREHREEMTLGEAFDWYIEHHAIPQGLKTIEAMRGNFERYLGAVPQTEPKKHGRQRVKSPGSVDWHNKKLSAIRPAHVVQLRASLAKESGKAAANHALKLVRSIYAHACKAKLFRGDNPAAGLGTLKIESRDRFLQKDELPRLFKALAETRDTQLRDYVLLSMLTGARKSNVLAMSWQDIDFDRRVWRIPDTKNGSPVIVQLPDIAVDILRERHDNGSEWVFPGRGKSGHMESPKKGVKSLMDRAGITGVRIHDLRRTLGSWQAITGASLAIIGKSLGHKSVDATLIYARLSADPVRESVERATAAMIAAGCASLDIENANFLNPNPQMTSNL